MTKNTEKLILDVSSFFLSNKNKVDTDLTAKRIFLNKEDSQISIYYNIDSNLIIFYFKKQNPETKNVSNIEIPISGSNLKVAKELKTLYLQKTRAKTSNILASVVEDFGLEYEEDI